MNDFLDFVSEIMEDDNVTMDMTYNQGKWDSVMMLTLIMELESKYGVSIPLEKIGSVKTLADLYDLIK